MSATLRFCLAAVTAMTWLVVDPALLTAQGTPPKKKTHNWSGSVEASGNVLYGAASQRVVSGGAVLQWADQGALYKLELQAGYGDSRKPQTGERNVIVRNTRLATMVDLRRRDRVSPYTFATAASSLQQRFTSRVDAGAGARMILWTADTVINGFVEDATINASILGEQTRPMPTATSQPDDITRIRWSLRANYRKRLSSSLRLTHATLYQPSVNESSRYTLDITTVLAAPVYARTELTITHRERIDTEAVDRGAPSRRDGQLLFGVRTGF